MCASWLAPHSASELRATAAASGESANPRIRADSPSTTSSQFVATRNPTSGEKTSRFGFRRGRPRRRAVRAHAREERVAQVRLNPKPAVFVATRGGARRSPYRLPIRRARGARARVSRGGGGAFGARRRRTRPHLLASSGVARTLGERRDVARTPLAASRPYRRSRFSSATGTTATASPSRASPAIALASAWRPGAPRRGVDERLGVRALVCTAAAGSPLLWFHLSAPSPTEASARNTHWLMGAPTGQRVARAPQSSAAVVAAAEAHRRDAAVARLGVSRNVIVRQVTHRHQPPGRGFRLEVGARERGGRDAAPLTCAATMRDAALFLLDRAPVASVASSVAPSDAAKRAAASSSRSYTVTSAEPVFRVSCFSVFLRTPLTLSRTARRVRRSNKPRRSSSARARASDRGAVVESRAFVRERVRESLQRRARAAPTRAPRAARAPSGARLCRPAGRTPSTSRGRRARRRAEPSSAPPSASDRTQRERHRASGTRAELRVPRRGPHLVAAQRQPRCPAPRPPAGSRARRPSA